MATVRLEFELDSDVYPELYAVLSALRGTRARGERMRHLAAAGLVWENVRIHGAAAIGPSLPVTAEAAPASVPLQAPVPEPARAALRPAPQPRAVPDRRTGSRSRAVPPARAPDLRGDDFVDLALNAVPDVAPEPPPPPRRRASRQAEPVVRDLPVLMDVVAEPDDGSAHVETHPPTLSVVVSPADLQGFAQAEPVPRHDADVAVQALAGDDGLHVASLAQKPATRSRLMRMKEKGLFKNG